MDNSELSIAAIRSLGIDMINKANSGHPGMVLGSAPALYTLFNKEMDLYAKKRNWINRDRFVLASGHASALLYSILHLAGFEISIEDLKNFRQYGSITPGHPEWGVTPGVEASTGPLGQGIAMAAGMAIAEKSLAARYNQENFPIIDHYTFALCGDGDLQEGVTNEAIALAGHLSLGKLIVLYDSNKVTLDGPLCDSSSVNQKKIFEANNWQVIEVADGNDIKEIRKAIKKGKRERFKPSIIIINTVIGYGSKNQGTNKVHGSPLGKEDGEYAKKAYGFNYKEDFFIPEEVRNDFNANLIKRGKSHYKRWKKLFAGYKEAYPQEYIELNKAINNEITVDFTDLIKRIDPKKQEATRDTSLKAIQEVAKYVPNFLSGTADLASSTKTTIADGGKFCVEDYSGRNLAFGIREFAMVTIMNGVSLHGGIKISGGSFLVFSDYMKSGIRSAAMMKLPIILPLSHDSIAVGEDGPTHQPIEQLTMLRTIPNLRVFRPADAIETIASWKIAIEAKENPTAIILTRQGVPVLENSSLEKVSRGGYIISPEQNVLEGIIIASGSEVALAIEAQKCLQNEGIDVRVVSMVEPNLFDQQDKKYREEVLPDSIRTRMALEMGTTNYWYKYVGLDGLVIGIDKFGVSGKAQDVIDAYGFTVDKIVESFKSLIKGE